MNNTIQIAIAGVRQHGPTRVVINSDGYAVTTSRAKAKGHEPVIVFVRNDGWTLGAPEGLERVAFDMWPTEWVGYVEDGKFHKIENYKEVRA